MDCSQSTLKENEWFIDQDKFLFSNHFTVGFTFQQGQLKVENIWSANDFFVLEASLLWSRNIGGAKC